MYVTKKYCVLTNKGLFSGKGRDGWKFKICKEVIRAATDFI